MQTLRHLGCKFCTRASSHFIFLVVWELCNSAIRRCLQFCNVASAVLQLWRSAALLLHLNTHTHTHINVKEGARRDFYFGLFVKLLHVPVYPLLQSRQHSLRGCAHVEGGCARMKGGMKRTSGRRADVGAAAKPLTKARLIGLVLGPRAAKNRGRPRVDAPREALHGRPCRGKRGSVLDCLSPRLGARGASIV